MMLHTVRIKHFQSLHDIDIELAPFTVIVGPSSSGKSAFVRALKTLVANRRGTDFIEHGQKLTLLEATTHGGKLALQRGHSTAENSYRVTTATDEKVYTKLGGEVPPEVSAFLGIDPHDDVHFAGQFDKPYLLDSSPAEVARVLGSLTNVSVLFEASREANRQRLGASGTLRTRQGDLEALRGRLEAFRGLPARLKALEEAERLIEDAVVLKRRISGLAEISENLSLQSSALAQAKKILEGTCPSLKEVDQQQRRLRSAQELLKTLKADVLLTQQKKAEIEAYNAEIEQLQQQRRELLVSAGSCPLCGQSTKELI